MLKSPFASFGCGDVKPDRDATVNKRIDIVGLDDLRIV